MGFLLYTAGKDAPYQGISNVIKRAKNIVCVHDPIS